MTCRCQELHAPGVQPGRRRHWQLRSASCWVPPTTVRPPPPPPPPPLAELSPPPAPAPSPLCCGFGHGFPRLENTGTSSDDMLLAGPHAPRAVGCLFCASGRKKNRYSCMYTMCARKEKRKAAAKNRYTTYLVRFWHSRYMP